MQKDLESKNNQSKVFIETDYTKSLTKRALWYLNTGFPIHLRGPAGVGKTSLAFHIANQICRPIIFMSGSQELNKTDLIGEYIGLKSSLKIDNYISSVYKREEEQKKMWIDGHLVKACREGSTLIYDEFTRTSPQVNNQLLSILEEKIIEVPNGTSDNTVIKVHPNFRIIFTSNPSEYVGVYKSANALIDRMITIDMNKVDEETEKRIIMSKTNLPATEAMKIIQITERIREVIKDQQFVSIRCSIMLASIISQQKIKLDPDSDELKSICMDIYGSPLTTSGLTLKQKTYLQHVIDQSIQEVFNHERG